MSQRELAVVDYDTEWPRSFETERRLLSRALGKVALAIHHIGSTAVPGLAAKPIIDILIEVTSPEALDTLNQEMSELGYEPRGEYGIPGRRFFEKGGDNRTHHIHAFRRGDFNITRHIAFRDYLRLHPEIAREYGELKKAIAATCWNDIERYCDRKDAYVKQLEATAVRAMAPRHSL
jgi:GrpB-like predicted nucleotidyltransferase (UPF0157 family)